MGPKCGHCGGNSFSYSSNSQGGMNGYLVYCAGCGAVVSWTPDMTHIENSIRNIENKTYNLR
jgi:hypothetical protein